MLEAGLVEHYKYETWLRMKKEYVESDEPKIVIEERSIASGLTMDDLQGLFYLCGIMILFALMVFLLETAINWVKQRQVRP